MVPTFSTLIWYSVWCLRQSNKIKEISGRNKKLNYPYLQMVWFHIRNSEDSIRKCIQLVTFSASCRAQNQHRKINRLSTYSQTCCKIVKKTIHHSLILHLFYKRRLVKKCTICTMEFFSCVKIVMVFARK